MPRPYSDDLRELVFAQRPHEMYLPSCTSSVRPHLCWLLGSMRLTGEAPPWLATSSPGRRITTDASTVSWRHTNRPPWRQQRRQVRAGFRATGSYLFLPPHRRPRGPAVSNSRRYAALRRGLQTFRSIYSSAVACSSQMIPCIFASLFDEFGLIKGLDDLLDGNDDPNPRMDTARSVSVLSNNVLREILHVEMSVHHAKQKHQAPNVDEHGRSAETMDRPCFDKICVDMTAILGLHGFAAHHGDVANADYRNIPLITIVRSKQSRNKNLMTGTDTSLLE